MRSFKLKYCVLLLIAVLGGCASAEKRLNQGSELEARGQYESAVMRYVQALEKDPGLDAARTRLLETGNLAITEQIAEAEAWATRGRPVRSAGHYRRADGVVASARTVGVRLSLPPDYGSRRRGVFADAFDDLIERAVTAREQGRWQDGLADCRRAQEEFEPTVEQRNRGLVAEADLYLQWSESAYERGHWRDAFDAAAQVMDMQWSRPQQSAHAAALMEDSLAEGEVELIVLPVQTRSGSPRQTARDRELAAQIETALWHGPWRQPPAFVSLNEPLAARDLMTNTGILQGDYDAGTLVLILRLAEADYGAHLQLLSSETTEFDVRSKTHNVKTRDGKPATFVQEDGQRRIQATARVVIADSYGNTVADVVVSGTGTAKFARGVYAGNPRDLNLGSRHVDLFNRIVLAEQKEAARGALVHDLAANIAGAVFQPTLAQIP